MEEPLECKPRDGSAVPRKSLNQSSTISWPEDYIEVTFQNYGEIILQYSYKDEENKGSKGHGTLRPGQMFPHRAILNVRYAIHIRYGRKTETRYDIFTRDTDLELSRFFK